MVRGTVERLAFAAIVLLMAGGLFLWVGLFRAEGAKTGRPAITSGAAEGVSASAGAPAAFVEAYAEGRARGRRDVQAAEKLEEIPADRWLGAPEGGLSGEDLRGDVVLVEFWTYLCYNCKNVEPWMKETHATYSKQGLKVIGVHTPEFEVERNVDNVIGYMRENGITYPVAIDNGFKVWRKYNKTNAWPAFLVYDRAGQLVYRRSGEGAVHEATEAIERALAEKAPQAAADARDAGVEVTTTGMRESPQTAAVEVSFRPRLGYLLVKSPPNEVRLGLEDGVTASPNPAFLGDPFTGADSRDVRYYDGPASLRIPLEIAPALAGRPLTVRGEIVYHVCDERTKVCARQETSFIQPIEAS
jgi:thiol-disulfide isomerase/thioredoxin